MAALKVKISKLSKVKKKTIKNVHIYKLFTPVAPCMFTLLNRVVTLTKDIDHL